MTGATARLAAEQRLEDARDRRHMLEKDLAHLRFDLIEEIHVCAELGTPKTIIAELAGLDRSRVYQILAGPRPQATQEATDE